MYEKLTLANGVRIAYERMEHVRTASVGIWVSTGSRNETAAENGAAHFIEHMLFKGTRRRTAAQLAEEMDAIGGQVNAFTTRESTCFYARVLDDHLDLAIDLLGDMFFSSSFAPEDIASERGVIKEEIDMYDDEAEDLVTELMFSKSLSETLARPVLGTAESLKRLDREALLSFKERNYIAPGIVIAISGSFSDASLGNIKRLFAQMPVAGALKPEPAGYTGSFAVREKDFEQNHLCLGFKGLHTGSEDRFSMQVLSTILGGGMSSRLFQTIREKHGLCYSIYSFSAAFCDNGIFGVSTALGGETELKALGLILEELERFRQDGITEAELNRAREQSKAGVLMALESTSSRMNRIGFGELMLGRCLSTDELIERYNAVTRESVLTLAQRILKPEELSFSAVGRLRKDEEYRAALALVANTNK